MGMGMSYDWEKLVDMHVHGHIGVGVSGVALIDRDIILYRASANSTVASSPNRRQTAWIYKSITIARQEKRRTEAQPWRRI
jgi:hypothetical protein